MDVNNARSCIRSRLSALGGDGALTGALDAHQIHFSAT